MWFLTILVMVANIGLYSLKPGGDNGLVITSNLFPIVCSLIAAVSLFMAFSSLKVIDETKTAWLMLLIAIALYFFGRVTYGYYEVIAKIQIPFPSLADGFRLAAYLFLFALMLDLIISFKRASMPVSSVHEFLSLALLLGLIFYVLSLALFIPILTTDGMTPLKKFLNVAYPVADLLIIFFILVVMQFTSLFSRGIFFKPWRYILAGFIFMCVGDIFFSYYNWTGVYNPGNYIDLFANTGFLLIGFGADYERKIIKSATLSEDKSNDAFMWLLIVVILMANLVSYAFSPAGETVSLLMSNLFPNICSLIAVAALFLLFNSLKTLDETKAAWLLLMIGVALYFMGEFTYGYYEIVATIKTPSPSMADGFRLAGYVFLNAGLVYLLLGFKRAGVIFGSWKEFICIGALLGILFCLLSLALFIPIITSADLSAIQKFLNLAYPLGDLVLIFLVLILLRVTTSLGKGVFSLPWKYMIAGFILMGTGDILFSYYSWLGKYNTATYLNLCRNAGYLLLALSATTQRKIIRSL
jgi:hypothetical protein